MLVESCGSAGTAHAAAWVLRSTSLPCVQTETCTHMRTCAHACELARSHTATWPQPHLKTLNAIASACACSCLRPWCMSALRAARTPSSSRPGSVRPRSSKSSMSPSVLNSHIALAQRGRTERSVRNDTRRGRSSRESRSTCMQVRVAARRGCVARARGRQRGARVLCQCKRQPMLLMSACMCMVHAGTPAGAPQPPAAAPHQPAAAGLHLRPAARRRCCPGRQRRCRRRRRPPQRCCCRRA